MAEKLKGLFAAPTRRHLLTVTTAAVGLPFVWFSSRSISHGEGNGDPQLGFSPTNSFQCLLDGTAVLTPDGEVGVEELRPGDLVVTKRGIPLPIKWVGRRRFSKLAGSNWQQAVMPVRVSRFALDEQTPHEDLYLSPSHGLFLDGALIPAVDLINGTSIVQTMPEGLEQISYYHIELASHEVIFAEGAAVETLLALNDRECFDNFVEYERLYGTHDRGPTAAYAPRVCYNGGRSELKALLRRAASTIVDIRDPIQVAYDKIAARAA
jgi:hypothetical protein